MTAHARFAWNELTTRNVQQACRFYQETLGWTFEKRQINEADAYWIASVNGQDVAGLMEITPGSPLEHMPDHWFAYIEVDDVDARVAKVQAAGGEVIRPPFEIPKVGRIAIVRDAAGAVAGWMTGHDARVRGQE